MHWFVRVLIIAVLALAGFQPALGAMPVTTAAETAAMQDQMQAHRHHQGMTMPAMAEAGQDLPGQPGDKHPCGQKMALCCFHAPAIGAEASGQAVDAAATLVALRPASSNRLLGQVVAPQLGPPRDPVS